MSIKNKKSQLGNMIAGAAIFLMFGAFIALGILGGAYLYFGFPYDTRQIEADILNYQVTSCIKNHQFDWESSLQALNAEFLKVCSLNPYIINYSYLVLIK